MGDLRVAVAAAGDLRIGPGAGGRCERCLAGLPAGEFRRGEISHQQAADGRGHVALRVLDAPDDALLQLPLRLDDERLVMPTVGHHQMHALLIRELDDAARVRSAGRHRLLAHDVEAPLQRGDGVLRVERVRRGDHDAVEFLCLQQLAVVLRGELEAEAFLDFTQLLLTEPADGDELHVVPLDEEGHVVGGGPPPRPNESEARFSVRHESLLPSMVGRTQCCARAGDGPARASRTWNASARQVSAAGDENDSYRESEAW